MPTTYLCPRGDLACTAAFATAGDLDYHLSLTHGYRGAYRIWTAVVRPPHPIGPAPSRHVPDGLTEEPASLTFTSPHAPADRRADATR